MVCEGEQAMENFRGKITDGDQIVVDNVEGQLYFHGASSWDGKFEMPSPEQIQLNGSYTLALDDGRKGSIIITGKDIGSGTQWGVVRFQGSGALE